MQNDPIPSLTTELMVEVDRLMIDEYGILLIQMMENAGRNLAALTRRRLGGDIFNKTVIVVAGMGNNGGGGLVAARHLSNWGVHVELVLAKKPGSFKEIPAHQFAAIQRLPVKITIFDAIDPPSFHGVDAVLDALIGYGLQGNPRDSAADLIRLMNESRALVISLDAPSGLDTTTGKPGDPCVDADLTMTLALPKVGLRTEAAQDVVGDLYLADISVPPSLYEKLDLTVPPLFSSSTVILMPDIALMEQATLARVAAARFSPEIDKVMLIATSEAKSMRSRYVSTGHLLLAIAQHDGRAGDALRDVGFELERTRELVRIRMLKYKRSGLVIFGKPELSQRVERLLSRAAATADKQGDPVVDPGHILMALLSYDRGIAVKSLKESGISRQDIRHKLES